MKLSAINYAAMSDHDLDAAYAAAWNSGNTSAYTATGILIVQREARPILGFVENLFAKPFPQYDAIRESQGYFAGSVDAPAALSKSAGNIGNYLKSLGGTAMLGLLAAGAISAAYVFRTRK